MVDRWRNTEYLKHGNERQRQTYEILKETAVLSVLNEFDPVVAGTIPIGIDIERSDIDIVCQASDLDAFGAVVRQNFSCFDSFTHRIKEDERAYVASFIYAGQEIEIYAQDKPTQLQNGYRHMVVEDRILRIAGESFRRRIIELKQQGFKTEPAFGILLDLADPYLDLLNLENSTDDELQLLID